MSENVLAMTLRMRNHAKTTAANLRKQVKGIGDESTRMGTKFGKGVKAAHSSLSGLLGSMISLKAIIIAAFAYKAVARFARWLGKLNEKANEGQVALVKLQQGLASFGNYTKQNEVSLINLSNALQQQTGVADNVSQEMMGLLGTYRMEADKIRELTPLIIDFAKAKGVDLKTAFDLVGKANVGYTGTLSRYGIILDENLTKEEKMVELEKYLAKYRGTAAALSATYAGQVEILSANYGDLQESMGKTLQRSVAQSGIMTVLNNLIKDAIVWWDKWGIVVADKVAVGLGWVAKIIQKVSQVATSSPVIKFFISLANYVKVVYYYNKLWFTELRYGLKQAANLMSVVIVKAQQLWAFLFGSDEDRKNAKLMAEEVVGGFWNEVDRLQKEKMAVQKDTVNKLFESGSNMINIWTTDGYNEWKSKMEERRQKLQEAADAEKAASEGMIVNGEKHNEVLKRTIQLTKTMAQQFAMATRLEQEQTKFLMRKLRNMSPDQVGNLSQQEKDLISKQGVLKKAYEGVFSEYAEKQLGIKSQERELKAKLTIELTEEASRLLKVSGEASQQYRNVQFEMADAV